jgi:hypothetical protein
VVKGVEMKRVIDALVTLLHPRIYRIPMVVGHNLTLTPFAAGNGKRFAFPFKGQVFWDWSVEILQGGRGGVVTH